MAKLGVSVENRSEWPTWLVRWMVRKACADAGVKSYRWVQVQRTRPSISGIGCSTHGHGGCNRRALRAARAWFRCEDHRWKGAPAEWIPHTSLALLAFLIRHEVAHARGGEGHPSEYVGPNGRTREYDMEDACNEAAGRFVRALAAEWPAHLADWLRLARAARTKRVDRSALTLASHQGALAAWTRKLKLAQTKVRKYRALARSAERRIAARPGPKGGA